MTIRFQCDDCGSVLKIEDRKAGTSQKCPKCKKQFVVPEPELADAPVSSQGETSFEETIVSPPKTEQATPSKLAGTKPAAEVQTTPDRPARKVAAKEGAVPPAVPASKSAGNEDSEDPLPEKPAAKGKPADSPAKPAKSAPDPKGEDDFDPADFLMESNSVATKPAPVLTTESQEAKKGPSWARGARRMGPPDEAEESQSTNSAAAAANSQLGASANARDLLSKSMEDSRIRSATLPPEKVKEPWLDLSGVRQEFQAYLPQIIGGVVAIFGIYWFASGIFADRSWRPDLAPVTGKITIEGKPYANLTVTLNPYPAYVELPNGKRQSISSSQGVTDEEGVFDVYYPGKLRGAPVGKVKVQIEPLIATPEMIKKIPRKFAAGDGESIDVTPSGNSGKFDFDLLPGR